MTKKEYTEGQKGYESGYVAGRRSMLPLIVRLRNALEETLADVNKKTVLYKRTAKVIDDAGAALETKRDLK